MIGDIVVKRMTAVALLLLVLAAALGGAAQTVQEPAPQGFDVFMERHNVYWNTLNASRQKKYTPAKAVLGEPDSEGLTAFTVKSTGAAIKGSLRDGGVVALSLELKTPGDRDPVAMALGALRPQGYVAGLAQGADLEVLRNDAAYGAGTIIHILQGGKTCEAYGYTISSEGSAKDGKLKKLSFTWSGKRGGFFISTFPQNAEESAVSVPSAIGFDDFVKQYNEHQAATDYKNWARTKGTLQKAGQDGLVPFTVKNKKITMEGTLKDGRITSLTCTLKYPGDAFSLENVAFALLPAYYMELGRDLRDASKQCYFGGDESALIAGYRLRIISKDKNGYASAFQADYLPDEP